MKKVTLAIAMAALVLFAGCKKDKETIGTTLKASIEQQQGNGSKTSLDPSNGAIKWTTGDKIVVNNGTTTGTFTLTTGAGTTTGTFTYNGEYSFDENNNIAVYPETATISGNSITVTLPAEQTYAAARNGSTPMLGTFADPNNLTFTSLCGVLGISLKAASGDIDITAVEVVSKLDEKLNGTFTCTTTDPQLTVAAGDADTKKVRLNCTTTLTTTAQNFYFAMPVGTLASGFRLNVYGDGADPIFSTNTNNDITIVLNQVNQMPEVPVTVFDPLTTPLTLEAQTDGTIVVNNPQSGMQYSLNGGAKALVTSDAINVSASDTVAFYGNGTNITSYNGTKIAGGTAQVKAYGNIMSLVDEENFATAITLTTDNTFRELFRGNTTLTDASGLLLPATTLASSCYYDMFNGCTSLTTAPELPSTTLAVDCYDGMFQGCTSLVTAPALPAETLASDCYRSMFKNCTSLTTAPALPATTLANYCYRSMFSGCTSLTTAPVLPATTLEGSCYNFMFNGCTSLSSITCLATEGINENNSTSNWLQGVASTGTFTKASSATWPEGANGIPSGWTVEIAAPAATVTTAPTAKTGVTAGQNEAIVNAGTAEGGTMMYAVTTDNTQPASTDGFSATVPTAEGLTAGTYYVWYYVKADASHTDSEISASGIEVTIAAPAATVTTAPTAKTGVTAGQNEAIVNAGTAEGGTMMYAVTSDNTQPASTDGFSATVPTAEGLTAGTYYVWYYVKADASHTDSEISATGIEVTIEAAAADPLAVPLTMEALSDGTIVVNIVYPGGKGGGVYPGSSKGGPSTISMKYSVNGGAKQAVTSDAIPVSAGDRVQLYGNGPDLSNYGFPDIAGGTAQVKVYGNIMSMLDEDNYATLTTLPALAFYGLFGGNTTLTDASGLLLPATTLAVGCYGGMFYGCTSLTAAPALPAMMLTEGCYTRMFADCTSLTTAPTLPATDLAGDCYDNMFSGCTSLVTAPTLPAETLAGTCYYEMFYGCTSLTTAPELPATTLASSCYNGMFNGCTSLTTAPVLPAPTLTEHCYDAMFQGCTSLVTAPALPAETLASDCYRSMFKNCTSLTTAPALPATTLANYCYRSMFSGCTSLTTAPVLPATTLANSCYNFMFSGCTSLNSVTCMATDISASNCINSWLQNVAATGTFTKASGATWPTGSSGIPSGWTVNEQ